ncbi:protein cramped [Anopheles marshallii]|uniref:protein cramped n=1 Tax=Anopheles marshallii TaxID=1521116 RepID=UPI00237C3046|nr:protein cramped [Anopheles marshallii]
MYASSSSNCFAGISNFKELRYTTTPSNKTGSLGEELETTNHSATTSIVALHFASTSTTTTTSSQHDVSADGSKQPSDATMVPIEPCNGSEDAVPPEMPTSPEQSGCTEFAPSTTDQPAPNAVPSGRLPKQSRKESVRGCSFSLPAEELLGSVTTFYPSGDLENGQTLRTSARVKHKLRMETIRSNTPPLAERKEPAKPPTSSLLKTPNQPKQMRVVWSNHDKNLFFEALNEYGKDFEAILNYLNTKKRRKDNTEQQVFKSKDVRNLYYQFNQKAMKYIHFSDEVKKEAQELYALINYGEMRRKVPFQNKKYFHKLKDLVYKGFTTVREKGKNIRIKTPSCRALRKLNQLEEWQEEIKLPPKVDVLLKPSTTEAWGRVQSLAQNPRVHITVTIQKRLSALLQMFQQKWRAQDVRLVERLDELNRTSTTISSKLTRQRMQHEIQLFTPPDTKEGAVKSGAPILRFIPAQNAVIHRPMISLTDFQSNTSICLNSYEQRIGVKVPGETLCVVEKPTGCKERPTGTGRRQRTDSGSEKVVNESKKPKYEDGAKEPNEEKPFGELQLLAQNGPFTEHFKSPNASNESTEMKDFLRFDGHQYAPSKPTDCDALVARQSDNSCDGFALTDGEIVPVARYQPDTAESSAGEEAMKGSGTNGLTTSTTTTTTITNTTVTTSTTTTTIVTVKKKKKCHRRKGDAGKSNSTPPSMNHFRPLVSEEQMQRIRDGWTLDTVGDLTVGDIYIMFGAEMKVELEYDWVRGEPVVTQEVKECQPTLAQPVMDDAGEQVADEAKPKQTIPEMAGVETAGDRMEEDPGVSVKEEVKEQRRCPVDSISRRLKSLLFLASLENKDMKKRVTNANAAERKPKRTENEAIPLTQDDCLQFKHPMLPVRNPINHLVPDLHGPSRYKQSRWWRSRVNRQQAMHPLLPNMVRPPPSATVTSSAYSARATQPAPSVSVTPSVGESSRPVVPPSQKEPANVPPQPVEPPSQKEPANVAPQPVEPPSQKEPANVPPQPVADESVNMASASSSPSIISIPGVDNLPNNKNNNNINPTSSNMPRISQSFKLNTPVKQQNMELSLNDLSLSIFDLSLPSTSSSMMATLFSDDVPSGSALSAALPDEICGEKMGDENLNDLSLSGILSSLEPFPSPWRPPIDPDVDMSMLSESTVDYIARFQDIAEEMRSQQYP